MPHKTNKYMAAMDTLYRRLQISGIAFVVVMVVGTVGYRVLVPDSNWFDCFYMTAITITTIGYGEMVNLENNTGGRLFTVFMAFAGIGILTYFLSAVAAMLIEGELRQKFRKRKMDIATQKLHDHYIICGIGRIGLQIAEELYKTQRPFVFGDMKAEKVQAVLNENRDWLGFVGDCTDNNFLLSLGIQRAKGIFVATDDDNANLVICVTVKQLHSHAKMVAMCKEANNIPKLRMVGAEKVISPAIIGGMRMASEMIRPTVTTFLDVMLRDQNANLRVEEIELADRWCNAPFSTVDLSKYDKTLVLAIRQGDAWELKPKPTYQMPKGTILIVITTPTEREKLVKEFGK